MITLLEDYKRRLKTANEMLNEKNVMSDSFLYTRIEAKSNCYRTFIVELEQVLNKKNQH